MDTMTTQPLASVSEASKPKRRGGRPKLLPEERRDHIFKIGYTKAQYLRLAARADAAGLSEVELIRRLSLDLEFKTIPTANREAIIELNAIGNNVNQIARQLNQGAVENLNQESIQRWIDGVNQSLAAAGKRLVSDD